jgi:hypothetical protein
MFTSFRFFLLDFLKWYYLYVRLQVVITGIRVLQRGASVQFTVQGQGSVNSLRDRTLSFVLEAEGRRVWFRGTIASTSEREKVSFVVHMPVNRTVILKLIDMRGRICLLSIEDTGVGDLRELLSMAARLKGMSEEELLLKLTTFTGRDGREYKGTGDPGRLSEKQKVIVLDRLRKMMGFKKGD